MGLDHLEPLHRRLTQVGTLDGDEQVTPLVQAMRETEGRQPRQAPGKI